jgi:plasmid stabilization system protein ParE
MPQRVIFAPEAEQQLLDLYRYIAAAASPETAVRYTDALLSHCEKLTTFPERGTRRDDIRPGIRVTNYRRRTSIAFTVQPDRVEILGFFHAGRDYAKFLQESKEE